MTIMQCLIVSVATMKILQRHWNVGDKFAFESNVDRVLPSARQTAWTPMPQGGTHAGDFKPKLENQRVGNQTNYSQKRFIDVWVEMSLPVLQLCGDLTNKAGMKKWGANWQTITSCSMLKFICCFLRMAILPTKRMTDYFSPTSGDPMILSLNFSGRQFCQIYKTFTMYDPIKATEMGWSTQSNKKKFNSLHKVRPVMTLAIQQFQSMRSPPQILVIDEALSKYKVPLLTFKTSN